MAVLKRKRHQVRTLFSVGFRFADWKYTIDDANKFKHLNREEFEKIIQILKGIDVIANKHGATVTQIILAWYIKNPEISAVIPGARVPSQVADNVATLKIDLSTDEYQNIDNAFKSF